LPVIFWRVLLLSLPAFLSCPDIPLLPVLVIKKTRQDQAAPQTKAAAAAIVTPSFSNTPAKKLLRELKSLRSQALICLMKVEETH
jgi:hypothetical protein